MHYWFFGMPGSGKSSLASIFAQMTSQKLYEGDEFHTAEDREAVAAGTFTLERRQAQLARITARLRNAGAANAVITHPLPDRQSRDQIRQMGDVRLVYVKTPLAFLRPRLAERPDHHFTVDLLDDWIARHWQEPQEEENCFVVKNDLSLTVQRYRLIELQRLA